MRYQHYCWQVCIPVGCVPSAAVAILSCHARPSPLPCMYLPPCTPLCHTCPPRYTCPPTMHTPMWTEFLTHACENITFLQLLLQAVIILTDFCVHLDRVPTDQGKFWKLFPVRVRVRGNRRTFSNHGKFGNCFQQWVDRWKVIEMYKAFGVTMWGGFTFGKCICNKLVFL